MKEVKIQLPPPTLKEEDVSLLLSNAMADTCGFDWWSYNDKDYEEAKAQLTAEKGNKDAYCYEDVLARILFNGKPLRLLEADSDWHWSGHSKNDMLWSWQIRAENLHPVGGRWHKLTIKKLIKAFAYEMVSRGIQTVLPILEDGDFYDADAVVQRAVYGDVIYG